MRCDDRQRMIRIQLPISLHGPDAGVLDVQRHLGIHPLVDQDLSILVDESVKWKEIKDAIGMMVKELSFVEEYRGKQIPEGKKSIMLSYRIGNDDSTMTSKQIEKKMGAIVNVLKKKVGAELR